MRFLGGVWKNVALQITLWASPIVPELRDSSGSPRVLSTLTIYELVIGSCGSISYLNKLVGLKANSQSKENIHRELQNHLAFQSS